MAKDLSFSTFLDEYDADFSIISAKQAPLVIPTKGIKS